MPICIVRSGTYSTQLVEDDRSAIEALYRSSGFTHVKVTSAVKDTDKTSSGQALKVAIIDVTYTIDEGEQQKFGDVNLSGVGASRQDAIKALLSAETGQPFSLITLSNDRDAVLGYYLAHGFDLAQVEIQQQPDPDNKDRINVSLAVSEGHQVTIDHVLLSGLVHTKPAVVQQQITGARGRSAGPGCAVADAAQSLQPCALQRSEHRGAESDRQCSVEERARSADGGEAVGRDLRLRLRGADRNTGLGPGQKQGQTAAQNGKAGVSPRGSLDVSRINFRGTQQSLTLHTTFGLLERVATLTFNNPQFLGKPDLHGGCFGRLLQRAEHHDVPGARRCRETSA